MSHPVAGFVGNTFGGTSHMNRFFSKLDLRDIKIDPEGSRFPPDADEQDEQAAATTEHHTDVAEAAVEPSSVAESPAWTPEALSHTSEVVEDVHVAEETLPLSVPADGLVAGLPSADGEFLRVDCEVLKVSARSRPSAVAGAIAGVVREHGRAEVQAIGAGATNQAVKAVAIARDYLRETGIEAICLPAFIDVTIENEDRTAIRLVVEPR